ncbi:MAG: sulfatase [Candidatus Altiarchaeota archaeon]|nr:sulfatase [Candidatus Altiarchaeota archaeon]
MDHLSLYGYGLNTTPNIDRLAQSSVVFDQCITPVPVTAPSHASILTGLEIHRHGVLDNGFRFNDSVDTLAEVLSRKKYSNYAFVNIDFMESNGFEQGFNDDKTIFLSDSFKLTDILMDKLDKSKSTPFFMWIHYFDPHSSYMPREPFRSRFTQDKLEFMEIMDLVDKAHPQDNFVKQLNSLYDGELNQVDYNVGRIIDQLEENNLLNSTIIVIVADHGESIYEHGELTHGEYVYDTTIHVPLVIYSPMLPDPLNVKRQVSLLDIFPTLLYWLDATTTNDVDGENLEKAIFSPEADNSVYYSQRRLIQGEITNDSHFQESLTKRYSARSLPYKLIRFQNLRLDPPPFSYELYNILDDPLEEKNIYKENPDIAETLNNSLNEWLNTGRNNKISSMPELDNKTIMRLRELGYIN